MSMDLSVFFLLGILSRASRASCPDMEAFNGNTKVSNIPCIEYYPKNCSERNYGLPYDLSRDPVVSEPRDFKATTFWETATYAYDKFSFEYLVINVTWKAPLDELSQRKTEGYCLILQTLEQRITNREGFDLREFSFVGKTNYHFTLRAYPPEMDLSLYVTLYALPPRDAKDATTTRLLKIEKPRINYKGIMPMELSKVKKEEGTGMRVAIITSTVLFVVAIVLWASNYKKDWTAVKKRLSDNSETVTQKQETKPGVAVIVE